MPKLEVDMDKYFLEVMRERTELDMNEDPEVDNIKDITERKEKVDMWLECRIYQLKRNEDYNYIKLKKARDDGYLELGNYFKAKNKCHEIYETLRRIAKEKYEESISEKAIST